MILARETRIIYYMDMIRKKPSNKKKVGLRRPRIYLDNASSTPIDSDVLKTVTKAYVQFPANPSSIHKDGVIAREAIEIARKDVAKCIGAHTDEIIFTSGGTESNNMAIRGVIEHVRKHMPAKKIRVLISAIEHASIFEMQKNLNSSDVEVVVCPVTEDGIIDMVQFKRLLTSDTVLVSILYANNEIGTIQPIREIAKCIRHIRKTGPFPLFHTDAVQAIQYLPVSVDVLGVDLLTLNAAKLYGPRGVGVLYKRRHVALPSLFVGGLQEQGMRPGTEPTALIMGFAKALQKTILMREREYARLHVLQQFFFERIHSVWPGVKINGSLENRLPNNIHISIPNFDSELMVLELDARGIAVSARSACKSTATENSHVLLALGSTVFDSTDGSIRITLGRDTKRNDIALLLTALREIKEKYKQYLSG